MGMIRKMQVLVGVRAEQSLRDAMRVVSEQPDASLELIPVGRKDWVAGQRCGEAVRSGQLEAFLAQVHRSLLDLHCDQRIRSENLRLYVVQEPVPVFRDPEEEPSAEEVEAVAEPVPRAAAGPSTCPVCGRTVHSYNLHYNTDGRVVGCFMCGGHSGF